MEKGLTAKTFDYSVIEDKDAKSKLIYLEGQVKKKVAGIGNSMLDIGKDLATAQSVLANHKNGVFGHWLSGSFGYTEKTAYNYINAFRCFGEYPEIISEYNDVAMYALAAPKAPEQAVEESRKLAKKGVRITEQVAKQLIEKHKPKPSNGAVSPPKPEPPKSEPTPTQSPTQTVTEQINESVREEEEVEEKELTTEEKCEADNKEIEAFCRELTKVFDDKLPHVPWIDSQGRVGSAKSSLKACCNTLRQSKSAICPKCDDGQTKKGECTYCKGYGYLPKLMADAIGGDA